MLSIASENRCSSVTVETMTFALSTSSEKSDSVLGVEFNTATAGILASGVITPISGRTPNVKNFLTVCLRSKSLGTITSVRLICSDTNAAIIVSVFPVPVGITTVAGSRETVQCAFIANRAPICGKRNPLVLLLLKTNAFRQELITAFAEISSISPSLTICVTLFLSYF